jgi:hypothetical protein
MGFATEADAGTWPLRSSTTQGQVGRRPRAEMAENPLVMTNSLLLKMAING